MFKDSSFLQDMKPQESARYYSNSEVASQIAAAARGREAVGAYADGRYDSRPNVIQYPRDVVQLAARGIASFHISVERWSFPMQLATGSPETYERLRAGWDLLLDIDSKLGWQDAAVAARLICELLERYGIGSYGLKFSGRRGFHIIVPAEAFPAEMDYRPTAGAYPQMPRTVAEFIREKVKDKLMMELTARHTFKELLSTLENPPAELNPYLFVEVEKDWGPRHLFRAPYSLNEKTWLVSVPLEKKDLEGFDPKTARPDAVLATASGSFVKKPAAGEAGRLLQAALDKKALEAAEERREPRPVRRRTEPEQKVPEQYFPPCTKLILNGLRDGRKRSLFSLITFLRNAGWSWEEAEPKIFEWNAKNAPPLPRNYVVGQLRWHMSQNRRISPPKCGHGQFFAPLGLCQPDSTCKGGTQSITLKNPAGYPRRAMPREPRPAMKAKQPTLSCSKCKKQFSSWRGLYGHKARAH